MGSSKLNCSRLRILLRSLFTQARRFGRIKIGIKSDLVFIEWGRLLTYQIYLHNDNISCGKVAIVVYCSVKFCDSIKKYHSQQTVRVLRWPEVAG